MIAYLDALKRFEVVRVEYNDDDLRKAFGFFG